MTTIVAIAWAAIGIALGVWRTKNFLRRLDACFPNLPPSTFGWGEVILVLVWVPVWPLLILLDEPMTRSVLRGWEK